MSSAFPLLEKNWHDAVTVAYPAVSIVVQGNMAFANLFGGNTMLLRAVVEFLIAASAIDKIDITGAFIGENGGKSGIATLTICFAHEQRESAARVMCDACSVTHINRQYVRHQALPGSINFALEFEFLFGALVLLFYPEFGVLATFRFISRFNN